MNEHKLLVGILLEGSFIEQKCSNYPEIDCSSLQREIIFFFEISLPTSTSWKLFSNVVPKVSIMFLQIVILLRWILLSTVSSCEADRTFDALGILKIWLRSRFMTQKWQKSYHVHQENFRYSETEEQLHFFLEIETYMLFVTKIKLVSVSCFLISTTVELNVYLLLF